jgi:mannose-6-phosphate isomerase-like protein (cupin superfamily)
VADDFVIATGESHTVREFVAAAFAHVGIADWERFVDYDICLTRPAEVDLLRGDASKSRRVLGFEAKVKFPDLVAIMVDAEIAKLGCQPVSQLPHVAEHKPAHADERRDLYSFPEAKMIVAKKDTTIGGHYHAAKVERFILSEGSGSLRIDRKAPITMAVGKIYVVSPGEYHEFHLTAGSVLIGLNSAPYDPADDIRVVA